jgi:hypothetical protein
MQEHCNGFYVKTVGNREEEQREVLQRYSQCCLADFKSVRRNVHEVAYDLY